MVRFYREYDPAKDTVIFMQGIMVASDTVKKIDLLAEHYNVLVVEAIQEHYHYVFEEEPMAEVIELYYSLADYYIPREAQVRLVVGMSFGGKLACLMADKWQKERGQQPTVIMGDTVMVGVPAMAHAILNGELDK
jgi:thiamine pyrophosphate-dependent acetolactate synthase large subunit-like protein